MNQPTSIALAGYIGHPSELGVPTRSMKRIQRAIFDAEGRHSLVDRLINFQAIKTVAGDNISEVLVVTKRIDGRPIEESISIVYRNGRFKRATAQYADGKVIEHTLGGAISRIDNPIAEST